MPQNLPIPATLGHDPSVASPEVPRMNPRIILWTVPLALTLSCQAPSGDEFSLSRRGASGAPLNLGQFLPQAGEAETVGSSQGVIERGSAAFERLVRCESPDVVFKDEEGTGADRMMSPRLRDGIIRLGELTSRQWPGVRLRVTEAWDESDEHAPGSLHYEGRAADLTTSDLDSRKLGMLARLAVEAGLDWVYFEDRTHVHVSVRP
jgi:hypothetical protein